MIIGLYTYIKIWHRIVYSLNKFHQKDDATTGVLKNHRRILNLKNVKISLKRILSVCLEEEKKREGEEE